jgi:hypothetical protein
LNNIDSFGGSLPEMQIAAELEEFHGILCCRFSPSLIHTSPGQAPNYNSSSLKAYVTGGNLVVIKITHYRYPNSKGKRNNP